MSLQTAIQWCDSTANPTMGCDGCELWNASRRTCYAGLLHRRFGGRTKGYSPQFEILTEFPGRMAKAAAWPDLCGIPRPDKPWLHAVPRLIFISDMSDSLSSRISFEYLQREIVDVVTTGDGKRHIWLWLTKRPDRMADFADHLSRQGVAWPDNLFPGTSITTQLTATRIDAMRHVGNRWTIRFLSVEPQVEPIDLTGRLDGIRWVIQGGESGNQARPFDLDWIRSLKAQARAAHAKLFVKQLGSKPFENGKRLKFEHGHGGDWNEWPEDIRIRELP